MLGHTEFLRRDWLEEAVRHQSACGCFYSPFDVLGTNATNAGECPCDMHMTGVAMAALSSAVRWILENEYAQDNAIYADNKVLTLPFLRRLYDTNSSHDRVNKMSGQRYFFYK